MCGLVGAYGKELNKKVIKAVGYLAFFNQLRGMHSTGFAAFYENYAPDFAHTVGSFMKLSEDNEYCFDGLKYLNYSKTVVEENKKKTVDVFPYCIMVHGRFATQGEVNIDNAQPFTFPDITGMHNGTLLKHYYEHLKTYDKDRSDSYALYKHLNETPKDDRLDAVKEIEGAYALVWHDNNTNELSMVRNYERPLHIAVIGKDEVLLWASEKWMLVKTLQLCGISEKNYKVVEVSTRTLLTYGISDKGVVEVRSKSDIPFVHKVYSPNGTGYGVGSQPSHFKGSSSWQYSLNNNDRNNPNAVVSLPSPLPVWVTHFGKSVIRHDEWKKLTEGGCAVCSTPLSVHDHKDVSWYDKETPLCKDCAVSFANDLKGVG